MYITGYKTALSLLETFHHMNTDITFELISWVCQQSYCQSFKIYFLDAILKRKRISSTSDEQYLKLVSLKEGKKSSTQSASGGIIWHQW